MGYYAGDVPMRPRKWGRPTLLVESPPTLTYHELLHDRLAKESPCEHCIYASAVREGYCLSLKMYAYPNECSYKHDPVVELLKHANIPYKQQARPSQYDSAPRRATHIQDTVVVGSVIADAFADRDSDSGESESFDVSESFDGGGGDFGGGGSSGDWDGGGDD